MNDDRTWGQPSRPPWPGYGPPSTPSTDLWALQQVVETHIRHIERRLGTTEARQDAGEERKNNHQQRLAHLEDEVRTITAAQLRIETLATTLAGIDERLKKIERGFAVTGRVLSRLVERWLPYGVAALALWLVGSGRVSPETVTHWMGLFGHLFGVPAAGR